MSSFVLSLAVLWVTLANLDQSEHQILTNSPVFQKETAQVGEQIETGEIIAESGTLSFGDFALFRLTGRESELKLTNFEFDSKTNAIAQAKGEVKSGEILASSLLFGTKLTLADEKVSATGQGGSFALEKDSEATRLKVFSGNIELTLRSLDNEKTFQATLTSGKKIWITDELLALLFSAEDQIEQIKIWEENISSFEENFEVESTLINMVLEKIILTDSDSLSGGLHWVKGKFLFMSAALEQFSDEEIISLLAKVAHEGPTAVTEKMAELSSAQNINFKTSAGKALPYTRLFVSKTLSPGAKQKIERLADFSNQLASFSEISDLSPALGLIQKLTFIQNDPQKIKYQKTFLNSANNFTGTIPDSTLIQLFELIKNRPDLISTEWLKAYQALNINRVETNGLLKSILSQLKVTEFLVNANHRSLAADALRTLADLMSQEEEVLNPELLEKLANQANDLKRRLGFLTETKSTEPLNEKAYEAWLKSKESMEAPEPEEEIVEEEEEVPETGKIPRPQ